MNADAAHQFDQMRVAQAFLRSRSLGYLEADEQNIDNLTNALDLINEIDGPS